MASTPGGGLYVKSLFQLLALLQIPQRDVCRHLGLSPTFVSLMAKGRRPMPRKHLEAFEAFVWGTLREKNDAYFAAMDAITGNGPGYPLGDAAHEPLMFKPPPPDAPPVVHQWWAFHVRALELMLAWDIEVNPDPQCREAQALCGKLGQYHLLDPEKFDDIFLSPRRDEIIQLAERLTELGRTVERVDPRPCVDRLRATLQPTRPVPA
jgi:hypothetical protein